MAHLEQYQFNIINNKKTVTVSNISKDVSLIVASSFAILENSPVAICQDGKQPHILGITGAKHYLSELSNTIQSWKNDFYMGSDDF